MVKLQITANCILTPFNVRPLLTRPSTDKESPVPHDNMIQHVCEIISALRMSQYFTSNKNVLSSVGQIYLFLR